MKTIIFILTVLALFGVRKLYYKPGRSRNIVVGIAGVLGIIFFVLCIRNWSVYTIFNILLLISVCLCLFFYEKEVLLYISLTATCIVFLFSTAMYFCNLTECDPDVAIIRNTVICAKDDSTITGSLSGTILYVHGSVSEESVYRFYYQLEDGGIKQAEIPTDSTTIYLVEDGEEAYLETVITTRCYMNNNKSPATRWLGGSDTTYKLYVPQGSVTNVYEFDAE